MPDLAAALGRSGLFRGLDDERLARVAAAAESLAAAPGMLIIREGDPGDALYVVLEGAVQVFTGDREGREIVLARLEAGEHFGEQALLPGSTGRRSASVRAAEPTHLARVTKTVFQEVLAANDALREQLSEVGAAQARETLQKLSVLARGIGLDAVGALRRTLADGEVLFRQGDEADALYFVVVGRLAVWREDGGDRTLIRYVERGGCVGELALVRRDRRSATVIADGRVELLAVPRDAFDEAHRRSGAVRDHLATLARVYELPRRGIVTQHGGIFAGRESITTLHHLPDGRVFAAYRVVGQDLYALELLGVTASDTVAWSDPAGRARDLRLAADGTVIGVIARGNWPDAHALHLFVLDGGQLDDAARAAFERSGTLPSLVAVVSDEIVCHCVHVTADAVRAAIGSGSTFDQVQKATGCGTVCGSCVPVVVEMLGADEWVVADVTGVRDEAPGIRSFELTPRAANYPDARPGQHVVVEGLVRGLRVRRPYTLSSPARHGGRLLITVKREDEGVFSRWLFDERPPSAALRITRPRGDYVVDLSGRAAVCLVAGIGVTPALATARTAVGEPHRTPLAIHYSGRSRDRMACLAELETAAKNSIVELTTRETAREGRLDAAAVASMVSRFPDADWYVCGPAAYLEEVTRSLRGAGVAEARIHVEEFTAVGGGPATVTEDRTAMRRYLLTTPEPHPVRPIVRTLRRAGTAVTAVANSSISDWRVGSVQLNPMRWLEQKLARAARLDAAVPYEQLAIVSALAWGPIEYQLKGFQHVDALGVRNRELARTAREAGRALPPDTPDGDTFAYVMPAPPFPKFPPECVVDTGWTRAGEGHLIPAYVTRSRTAFEHLLRRPEHTDRGPIPYHFFQQLLGSTEAVCPGRKAAGLASGSFRDNARWSEDRAVTVDMLGFPVIDSFGPGMSATLAEACRTIDEFLDEEKDAVVDLSVLLLKLAYAIVVRAVLGDVEIAEAQAHGRTLSHSMHELLEDIWGFVMGGQKPSSAYLPAQRAARNAVASMVDLVRDLDRRGRLTAAQRALPTVRMMLETAHDANGGYERLYPLITSLVFAGHETTGDALSWALYEIARNPDLEAAVVREIADFRSRYAGAALTTAQYDERPFAFALMAETLRLHPPVIGVPRTPLADGVVPPDRETGIGSFRYPAGALVMFCSLAVHLDERRWRDPHAFRVERWFDGASTRTSAIERGRIVRAAMRDREQAVDFVPFGDGPGRCPGQHFNNHEFVLTLDALLSRYRFELADPSRPVPPSEGMLAGPEPGRLAVRIRRRS